MTPLLCASPRCKPPTRHSPDCVQDPETPCRGCLPARAADGLRLCLHCTGRIAKDAIEAAALWAELALVLVGGGIGDEIRQKNPGRGIALNSDVAEQRSAIRHTLVSWTRLIAEERGFTLPQDRVDALGRFVAGSAQWLAAQEFAGEVADELADLVSRARSLRQASGTRVVQIGPCPQMVTDMDEDGREIQTRCVGTLRALLRTESSLLPSAVQCDAGDDHSWDSTQWTKLGRTMQLVQRERMTA